MNKYYLQIIGAVLLFVGCVAGGYFLSDVVKDAVVHTGKTTGGGGGGGSVKPDSTPKVTPPQSDSITVQQLPEVTPPQTDSIPAQQPTVESLPKPEQPQTPAPQPAPQPDPAVSSIPVIKHIWFPKFETWPKKDPARVGYKVVVTATVKSKDKLKYELKSNDDKWSYSSNSGTFAEVYPTSDGKYILTVTNTVTGDRAERVVNGLVKHRKYTATDIETQLSSGALESMFYFYFAPNVKFKCLGMAIPANATPETLNALIGVAGMFTIDVKDETLQYDEWNRITSFDI